VENHPTIPATPISTYPTPGIAGFGAFRHPTHDPRYFNFGRDFETTQHLQGTNASNPCISNQEEDNNSQLLMQSSQDGLTSPTSCEVVIEE
jgi:hypothetical protein